jgi:hypothetical protein
MWFQRRRFKYGLLSKCKCTSNFYNKKKDNHWNPWFMRGKRSFPRKWYYDGTAAKNIFEVNIVSMNKNVYFFYCNCWFIKNQMSSNFNCIYIAMR